MPGLSEQERSECAPLSVFRELRPVRSIEKSDDSCRAMTNEYFRKKRKFRIATAQTDLLKRYSREKERASSRGRSAMQGCRGGSHVC